MENRNYCFTEEGKVMYGQRFGYAITYHVSRRKNKEGMYCVRIDKGMVPPEDPYMPYVSKLDMVSELLSLLTKEYGTLKFFIYGRSLKLTGEEKKEEIKTSIKKRQREFIRIAPYAPNLVAIEVETNIDTLLEKIDIF